ncbi:oxidoreductase [Xylanibacillus composti]|uniref:Oxidoreductase n=1 Tax=Xylanibacillus composti TaxID=1572762 RepID=A0A8J4M1L4_9BACL|nr:oxidoreductase [Xylanibacillus composti]MDT9725547.1 oxidoreductase [Xylanibacillus composti]GIQ67641.1 oxidoreductase [Xylanibacillus composti]
MRTVNVGLVGYGMAGQVFHASVISSVAGLQLHSVVERRSNQSQERYKHVKVVRSAEELVKDSNIELVVIATPNDSHSALAELALAHGKHVVVDKPFTVSVAEAQRLIRLAKQNGLLLSVFHNRRWDGDFMTVRQLITEGALGRVVEYEAHFDRYRPQLKPGAWREAELPGSGLLYDLGSHLIDQAFQLFGHPQTVYAACKKQRDGAQADDAFEIKLGYDDLTVTLKAGMLVRELGPHFVIHGTKGSFVKYGMDPQEAALKRGEVPGSKSDWGMEPEAQWGTLNAEIAGLHVIGKIETLPGAYERYYADIYESIVEGRVPAVKAEEALAVIRCIELANESQEKRRVVPFDLQLEAD